MLLSFALALPAAAQDLEEFLLADLKPPVFAFGGDVKLLGLGYRLDESLGFADERDAWSALASVRLKLEGTPNDAWSYEVHVRVEQDVYDSPVGARLGGATETATTLFRGLGESVAIDEGGESRLWAEVDYANVRFSRGRTDVVVGRQAITFGRSFFWNPTDWLSSFLPTEIDREYKGGVDALRVSHAFGRFNGVELVYAYGEDGARDASALVGRAYANWNDWDVEVLAGRVLTDDRLGFGWSGEVRGAGVRGELALHRPRSGSGEDDFVRATLKVDYRWPSSLHLFAELHFNGWGSRDPADYPALVNMPRFTTGQVPNLGQRNAAFQVSYELTPLLTATGAVLSNLDDGSGLMNPSVQRSLSDESTLVAGAIVPWGDKPAAGVPRSEYGTYAPTLWVQWRWSF